MGSFLRTLLAAPEKPEALVFYNSGVLLLAAGSPALDALEGLARAGVDLVACGTCVGFFELAGKLAAGRESNMQEIVSLLLSAERTLTI
jgi:intracellular sulfur oxidation DsrE/DsrF family protein